MPSTMREPVLTVDESRISSFDPQNPGDLSLLWSAFAKTSHVVEQGERLKNFSWRLWTRETLCSRHKRPQDQDALSLNVPLAHSAPATVPALSTSFESSTSTETEEETAETSDLPSVRPVPASYGSNERHITPIDLRNLVHSIKQPRDLKPPHPRPQKPSGTTTAQPVASPPDMPEPTTPRHPATESSTSTVATATDSFASTGRKSDTSVSSTGSSHSIVRGFTPGTSGMTSYRSNYQLAPQPQPILKKSKSDDPADAKKKGNGMFMLGCSSGSGASGEEDSLKDRMCNQPTSVLSGDSVDQSNGSKKQTSFKEEVDVMKATKPEHQDEAVFEESDDEDSDSDDDDDESAVEDDGDDAWEDEGSEAQEPEQHEEKEMKFYRVDSKANLPIRRSLLTLNIEDQRNGNKKGFLSTPAFRRSRTSTPNGPSMPASPEEDSQLEERFQQMQTSKPIIMATGNAPAPAAPLTSPRTTRRNMMAGELSESLRKNMLSERQQKNPLKIDSNQMKRANTARDVSKLTKLPEKTEPHHSRDSPPFRHEGQPVSWNHFFDNSIGEFHQAGW